MLNDLNGLSMAGGSTEERVVSGILAVLVVLCDLFLVNLWEHPVESICRAQPRTPFPLYAGTGFMHPSGRTDPRTPLFEADGELGKDPSMAQKWVLSSLRTCTSVAERATVCATDGPRTGYDQVHRQTGNTPRSPWYTRLFGLGARGET